MSADIVIRGGTVVDGTGSAGRPADVAITGGRISAVGEGLDGARVLDAGGQVVSPGFIDIHTHYDAQVFWDPALTPSSLHGVTTVVAGNCGFSIAPIRSDGVALLARTLQHVEDMSFDTLAVGVPWDEFETFPQYLDAVASRGTALNFGCYVGHTAVRLYVMGEDAYERAATEEEIGLMQAVVADAMAGGAAGFASSASPTHNGDSGRPVPSRVADLAELRALLEPVKQCGRGVVALLPGGVFPNEEVFRLQREVGPARDMDGPAHRQGLPLPREGDRRARRGLGRRGRGVAAGVVSAARVPDEPVRAVHAQHAPHVRRADGQVEGGAGGGLSRSHLAGHRVGRRQREGGRVPAQLGRHFGGRSRVLHPELADQPVAVLADERGCTPLDVMLDVSLDDDLEARFWSVLANDDPEGIAWLLPRDNVLLGLADSGAHVSQLCDACFSTDLLGNWVREKGVMPLERAIHKLTGEPAGVYGLSDRGTIAEGQAADVCVFDPETVAPGPLRRLRDFPADGERLTADAPVGMTHTLVNGVPIRVDGAPSEEGLADRPGVVLRS